MKHLNNELGKLRQEVKVGFIEVDNRFQSVNDRLDLVADGLQKITSEVKKTNESVADTQQQMGRIAKLVDDGFEVIQNFLSQQLDQQDTRLTNLERRMDQAGL